MSYQFIWNEKGVTAEFKGLVNNSEVREALTNFYGNSQFDEINFLIINLLQVEKLELTDSELLSIGATDAAAAISNPKVKIAVITNNEGILKSTDQ